MIIVNITILFFLTTIILSLLSKNKEGLTCSKKDDQHTKLLLDKNSKQISAIKNKVILNTNPLNSILNKIKYWEKIINETQNKSKSESNEISTDENLVIKEPLPKPIL
jgi:preprotein translocase subunit SecG